MLLFKSDLRRRVEAIERKIARQEHHERCAKGEHQWEMHFSVCDGNPFIRCTHCWEIPLKEVPK